MSERSDEAQERTLVDALLRLSGEVAGGTLGLARNTATLSAMLGESWLRQILSASMEPERLEAMAEAGHFLRDTRETAGLTLKELAESLGLADKQMLEAVESGEKLLPLELVLRSASLLARHDPIPFLLKFLRTYNPQLEKRLEDWGVMALPRQYERERRFINLYRKHDALRRFSDSEFQRYIEYMDSSSNLVLDVMAREKAAHAGTRTRTAAKRSSRTAKSKASPKSSGKTAGKARPPRRKN
ncbi:helix-turn-helix domain-containing protein [Parahaliea mediterranea]|uniref:helix-turn-helix domain-containing protein n=1 Tax=Parahaliea mediterranea TaxID=651086 RepID=UPI000E2F7020|nr:helix-turn-helix domain-containing protein [Parahaliea mediterranea]